MFDPNNPIVQLDVRGEPYWIPNDGRELRQARIVVWEDLDFERAHCLEIPFIEGLARHPETTLLDPDPSRLKRYQRNPYGNYVRTGKLRFPVSPPSSVHQCFHWA